MVTFAGTHGRSTFENIFVEQISEQISKRWSSYFLTLIFLSHFKAQSVWCICVQQSSNQHNCCSMATNLNCEISSQMLVKKDAAFSIQWAKCLPFLRYMPVAWWNVRTEDFGTKFETSELAYFRRNARSRVRKETEILRRLLARLRLCLNVSLTRT